MFKVCLSLIVFGLGFLTSSFINIQEPNSKEQYYLEVNCIVKHSKFNADKEQLKALDSALIRVYDKDFKLYSSEKTNKKGKCNIRLPLQNKFLIKVSKVGYVSKSIEINTYINFAALTDKKKTHFDFPCEVDVFDEVPHLDVSMLSRPIAKINFNYSNKEFAYDHLYTNKVNSDMRKMYKNYYALMKMQADSVSSTTRQ